MDLHDIGESLYGNALRYSKFFKVFSLNLILAQEALGTNWVVAPLPRVGSEAYNCWQDGLSKVCRDHERLHVV